MKKYLFLPSVPTPNGRLHLGHIGGPYLSADMCARSLRMQGHQAVIASGTDSYDSYVLDAAQREKSSPERICNKYHHLIQQDLQTMHIQMDAFINPLSLEMYNSYFDGHYEVLSELQRSGKVKIQHEYIPYDLTTQQFLTGFALKGHCPHCNSGVAGYFCESCGAHFKPEDIKHKNVLHEKEVDNLFLQVPLTLRGTGINESLQALYQQTFLQQNQLMRLTTHASWGLRANQDKQVLFNYGFIFVYYLLLAELMKPTLDEALNPFNVNSSVITISSFGIDNALPFISSILGMTDALPTYKPVDHYLVNHFYHLNGSKFSSSRRHAIWVNDMVTQNRHGDIIRWFLSSIDVRHQTGNVVQQRLDYFYDNAVSWLQEKIVQPFASLSTQVLPVSNTSFLHQLQHFISMQQNVLSPENFLPHIAVKIIMQCIEAGNPFTPSQTEYFWWLKALSILSFPIMPDISLRLWHALGYRNEPHYDAFLKLPDSNMHHHLDLNITMKDQCVETCA